MGAGRSIAVQNFNENASILLMIAVYSSLLARGLSIYWRDHRRSACSSPARWCWCARARNNQQESDRVALIGEGKH